MKKFFNNLFKLYLDSVEDIELINTRCFIDKVNYMLSDKKAMSPNQNLTMRIAQIISVFAVLESISSEYQSINLALDYLERSPYANSAVYDFLLLLKKKEIQQLAILIAQNWWGKKTDKILEAVPYDTSHLIKNNVEDYGMKSKFISLKNCATGSLGKVFYENITNQNYNIPGAKGGSIMSLIGPHDTMHILTKFPTNTLGEILLGSYVMGMSVTKGFWNCVTSILELQLSYNLFTQKRKQVDAIHPFPIKVWFDSYLAGLDMRVDVLSDQWNFWNECSYSIEYLRKSYYVRLIAL